MITFPNALRAWGTDAFARTLKAEIEALRAADLPLDTAATPGCHVEDSPVSASVGASTEDIRSIRARVGVFFTEIVANCGCGDDPFEQSVYCELDIAIDKATAAVAFSVVRN